MTESYRRVAGSGIRRTSSIGPQRLSTELPKKVSACLAFAKLCPAPDHWGRSRDGFFDVMDDWMAAGDCTARDADRIAATTSFQNTDRIYRPGERLIGRLQQRLTSKQKEKPTWKPHF